MLNLDITLTIVMFAIFIGIVVWAWSPSRKKEFEEASNLALEPDEITPDTVTKQEGQDHG
jgi:cytochrome c oxidase cbb3-type subunit 4